jgi:hypothetical protein
MLYRPVLCISLLLLLLQVAYTSFQHNVLANITRLRKAANASSSSSSSALHNSTAGPAAAFSGRRLLYSPTPAQAAAAAARPVVDMPLSNITQPWIDNTAWGRDQQPFGNVIVHQSFQVGAGQANTSSVSGCSSGSPGNYVGCKPCSMTV